MKNYFKKFSIMFFMAFAIILGNSVNAWAVSSIVTDKSVYLPGEKITVKYTLDNVKLASDPWLGIVPANTPHGSEAVNDQYDVQFQRPTAPSGTCIFTAPMKSGRYDFRFHNTDNNGKEVASSPAFEVNSNPIRVLSIELNKSTDNLQVGQTGNLVATTTPAGAQVTWKSSDSSIATVDSTGKVTAIKEGQATITATTTDGSNLSASCIVTVTTKPVVPTPQPTQEETIINTARAKGDNTNNASGSVSIIFKGVSETQLSVVKTADVESVYVGDTFTYTIVVTNTGSKTAKAVVINDNAPNHIDFTVGGITTTQGKVDPSSTSSNIVVNVGDIPPSGTVTIKIPATVIL